MEQHLDHVLYISTSKSHNINNTGPIWLKSFMDDLWVYIAITVTTNKFFAQQWILIKALITTVLSIIEFEGKICKQLNLVMKKEKEIYVLYNFFFLSRMKVYLLQYLYLRIFAIQNYTMYWVIHCPHVRLFRREFLPQSSCSENHFDLNFISSSE